MTGTTAPRDAAHRTGEKSVAQPMQAPPRCPPSRGQRGAAGKELTVRDDDTVMPPRRLRDDPRVPAFLISTIFHTLLLLILTLLTFQTGAGVANVLTAKRGDPNTVVSLQSIDLPSEPALTGSSNLDLPVKVEIAAVQLKTPISPRSPAPRPTDNEATNFNREVLGTASAVRLPGSGGLERRDPDQRQEFGKRYGATEQSERAVEAALEYLAAHQRDNGSWSFNLELSPCDGRCRHSKKPGSDMPTPSTGATGLALLAFMGAGHTHQKKGPYQETVRRGIYYLRAVAAEAEAGYDWQQGSMYGHGIALMALAEALSMSKQGDQYDSDLMNLVRLGNAFTCGAQHGNGSWGYVPGSPGDITLTGWQVLSLFAARKAGSPPTTDTLPRAKDFVMSTCTDGDYSFGYQAPPGQPTTTAIGLTLMLYLGESPEYTPFYLALTKMAQRGPTLTNIYHDYYATLALHHSRHWAWNEWNERLRDHLVATQVKSGHEKGSWHFPDRWGDVGGRLYTTAMCAMTLEIYYRYIPLYETIDAFPL